MLKNDNITRKSHFDPKKNRFERDDLSSPDRLFELALERTNINLQELKNDRKSSKVQIKQESVAQAL